mmetsp:Transcript_7856/g.23167  ORF Transcript_7856/g.23167 Transcript_7856/m.23167 type:complete len:226 (+) Transcript_7856:1406-2083(+)
MHAEDTLATLEVGKVNSDLAIKATRAEKGLIQNVNTVRSGNGDDAWIAIESIHLHKDLVDGLLTLVIATSEASTTLTTNRINLINENNARSILLRLREDITHTRRTHTNEHFNKLRTRNRDEWDSSLTSHGLGQQSLARTRRSVKNDTTRDAAPIGRVHLRLLKEINDLRKLELGTIATSNVLECDTSVWNHLNPKFQEHKELKYKFIASENSCRSSSCCTPQWL